MIRQAQPKDKAAIAKLTYLIWDDMELEIVKELPKVKVLAAIEQSIAEVEYRTYYEHVWVYEVNEEVAGCIIAYSGAHELDYEQQWKALNLDEAFQKFNTPLPLKEAEDDEMYIETVATFAEYRGQGVGTQLLKSLLESDAQTKWSLNCDKANTGALKLYKKLGFKVTDEIDLYGHDYYHMVYQGK